MPFQPFSPFGPGGPGMAPPGMLPPPPGMMPGFAPFGPQPPRKGGGRTFIKVLAVLFLVGSIGLNVVLFLALAGSMMGAASDDRTVQTTLTHGDSDQKIAVIPVQGMITDQTAGLVNHWLKMVENDQSVKALVLEVDTPGGGVTASDEIYHQLAHLKAQRNIPIVVTMGSLATSGGYYVSAPADYIFAQETTLTGNIGVLMPRYNLSQLAKNYGVTESTITAPAGGYKNSGSMFQPESEKDRVYLQRLIDQMYQRFAGIVKSGRQGKLNGKVEDICNGQVYTATEAKANGLIDAIGYADDAYAHAKTAAGLSNPTYIRYQRRMSFLDSLAASSNVAPGRASGGGGVNVNLKLDPQAIEELNTPRLMYLWRGE